MKKIVLCFIGFTSLWISIPTVAAQENHSVEPSSEVTRPILTDDSGQSTVETFSVNETNEEITGVFGTVPWTFEEETGTLTFGGGEFPETDWSNNGIERAIERNKLPYGKYISKIIFTAPVKANPNSSCLFSSLEALKSIENIDNLDTSNVTNMEAMFICTYSLTSIDVSNWDTSNVTNMGMMFLDAVSLTSLDVSNWDTSNVTDMNNMFYNCNSLTSLDVSNWDTSNVKSVHVMFEGTSLINLDISNWDTSNITDLDEMFSTCPNN